jgi:lysozyme family protein
MKRKTFKVSELQDWVNSKLVNDDINVEFRQGLATALAHVLLKTGNYNGFGYVYKDNERPYLPSGESNPNWTQKHETRRVYF